MLSPTVPDVFQQIPGLISCAGVTGRWGLLSHAQNTVRCLYGSEEYVTVQHTNQRLFHCCIVPWRSKCCIAMIRAIIELSRANQSQVESWQSTVECSRVKQSQVESSRVEQSHGRVQQSVVGSSRVEQSHSRVKQSQVESSRVKQSRVESSRVEQSRVESSRVEQSVVESSRSQVEHQSRETWHVMYV